MSMAIAASFVETVDWVTLPITVLTQHGDTVGDLFKLLTLRPVGLVATDCALAVLRHVVPPEAIVAQVCQVGVRAAKTVYGSGTIGCAATLLLYADRS
jgi:sorbitol-specific phosphotransferase system component IIBC